MAVLPSVAARARPAASDASRISRRVDTTASFCKAAAELTLEMAAESAAVFADAAVLMAATVVEMFPAFISTACWSSKTLRS